MPSSVSHRHERVVVCHVTEAAEGIHRLTNGVANFYLIQGAGKLVLGDAGAPEDWRNSPRQPPAAKIHPVQQRRG